MPYCNSCGAYTRSNEVSCSQCSERLNRSLFAPGRTITKSILAFCLGLVVHLYTTFVLMLLWNWFVVPTFHVGDISFWTMYGLVILVSLFKDDTDKNFADERRWKALMIAIDACIPPDQKENVKHELEEVKGELWIDIGVGLFGQVLGNSLTLGIGFLIHTFASA